MQDNLTFLSLNILFVKGTKNTYFFELLSLDLKSIKCPEHNRCSENISYTAGNHIAFIASLLDLKKVLIRLRYQGMIVS